MSGSLYTAIVRANTYGAGSTNPVFQQESGFSVIGDDSDGSTTAREPVILPPQALFNDLNQRLKSMAMLFGYDFDAFNTKRNTPQGVLAVTSSPLKLKGAQEDDLGMAKIQIDVSFRTGKIFSATSQDIVDSVQKTIIKAAESLLREMFNENGDDAILLKYIEILNDISANFREQIIAIGGFDGKYKPIVAGVAPQLADLICKAKQELETKQANDKYIPTQEDLEQALRDLNNRELDLLSIRQRNVTVAIFTDDPAKTNPGYMVQIAWPLNTKSSMDRRGAVPSQDQKRPNFWIQVNIHYDNKGNVLSVDGFGRGASPNPIDLLDAGERMQATKHAIINDFRWNAFMQLAEAILKNPNNARQIIEDFGRDIHIDNLGLMSPFGKERGYIAEIREANKLVLDEAQKNGGLSFADDVMRKEVGYDFVDVLVRVTGREDLRTEFTNLHFQPSITQDNMGTNTSRNASAPTIGGILRGAIVEPIQNNLRDEANTRRFKKFSELMKKFPDSEFITPFKEMFANSTEQGNGVAFWRDNKKTFLANLEKLRLHLESLMQSGQLTAEQQKLLDEYEKLTIFAMHLEHDIKPQPSVLNMRVMRGLLMSRFMPGFVADRLVAKLTDAQYSFIRQIIAAIMDKRVLSKQEEQTFGAALEQIFNCKSGKDRTGIFADFKAAWLVVMDNERLANRPFDFKQMDHYIAEVHRLLPHYVDKSVGSDIAEYNSPASKGHLGQNQGVKGIKIPLLGFRVFKVKNLIYPGGRGVDLVDQCDFTERDKLARLKDVRWEALEEIENRNKDAAKAGKHAATQSDLQDTRVIIKTETGNKVKLNRRKSLKFQPSDEDVTDKPIVNLLVKAAHDIPNDGRPGIVKGPSQIFSTLRGKSVTAEQNALVVKTDESPTTPENTGHKPGGNNA